MFDGCVVVVDSDTKSTLTMGCSRSAETRERNNRVNRSEQSHKTRKKGKESRSRVLFGVFFFSRAKSPSGSPTKPFINDYYT